MTMNQKPIVIFAAMLLLFACRGRNGGTQADETPADSLAAQDTATADIQEQLMGDMPVPKAADELFDDFIFNFAANQRLQLQRIKFPLLVRHDSTMERIERKKWKMEYFFMRQGYYTLLFDDVHQMERMKDTSVVHAVVEKIYLEKGRVKQYVFDCIGGQWMMTAIEELPLGKSHNASFLDFYRRFASDADFQAKSLNRQVKFVGPDPDDDFSQMEGVITAETWGAFAPELPSKMIYNIVYGEPQTGSNQKIFLLRGIANGLELTMNFKYVGGRWLLTRLAT